MPHLPNPSRPAQSLLLGAMALLLCPITASAEEHDAPHWHEKPHHLSLFLGGTNIPTEDETGFTIGADYEYRLNQRIGLGGVAEYASSPVDSVTLLATIDFHVTNAWTFQFGPGVEFIDVEEETIGINGAPESETINETNFVFRVGTFYEFEVGDFTIAPQVHYDITEEDALVFGVAFGRAF